MTLSRGHGLLLLVSPMLLLSAYLLFDIRGDGYFLAVTIYSCVVYILATAWFTVWGFRKGIPWMLLWLVGFILLVPVVHLVFWTSKMHPVSR